MMMTTAVSSGVRALTKGDAKSWLILKCIVAVLCAPLAVFMELHAFDSVALVLYGITFVLWLFGWLPGEEEGEGESGGRSEYCQPDRRPSQGGGASPAPRLA